MRGSRGRSFDDLRQENADSIGAERESELNHGEHDDPDIRKRRHEARLRPFAVLRGEHGRQDPALLVVQPWRGLRAISEHIQRHYSENDRRQTLDDEKPLPPRKAEHTVSSQAAIPKSGLR